MNRRNQPDGRDKRPRSSTSTRKQDQTASTASTELLDEEELEAKLSTLVHWRLLTKNVSNVEALMVQLGYPRPDLARRIFDRGDRVESALALPEKETGLHGTYDGERLAAEIFNDVNGLIEFEMRYGKTPTVIRMQAEQISELVDIRTLIRTEIRMILQSEVRAALQEELRGLLQSLPASSLQQEAEREQTQQTPTGLLTTVNKEMEAAVDNLFD